MDKSLRALCDALKKTISQLKPQQQALSFLLLAGKSQQGKTTLLRQSQLEHVTITSENGADIYYNQHGIILELSESWLNQSNNLLQYTLKQINRCHHTVKISGIILCVDINTLLQTDPLHIAKQNQAHAQLIERFGVSIGYPLDAAILFTKLDTLAGFCDFFQYEHASDLEKPFGFSVPPPTPQKKLVDQYRTEFNRFIETLGQQVLNKIHPARSGIKRTLIREFPLQLASLHPLIQPLIKCISPRLFHLQALYFTSAEQGGISLDRLNKKIQHEYALTVQDQFPQSLNYRAYFIEGALRAMQMQTKRQPSAITPTHKWISGLITSATLLALVNISHNYLASVQRLDEASKELIAYDALTKQPNKTASATYHLIKASNVLNQIAAQGMVLPTVEQLKTNVKHNAQQNIQHNFLPTMLTQLEQTLSNPQQSHIARYQALKIYFMLAEPQHFNETEVTTWFRQHWQTNNKPAEVQKKLALLKRILQEPRQLITINQQLVSDTRNYLNALPVSYLYYSLAKSTFPKNTQSITVKGFNLANNAIPLYLTKPGFQQIITEMPNTVKQLQAENWVLARQDLHELPLLLEQAYCYEYVVWWQNFMRKSHPIHAQDYQQARQLAQELHQSDALNKLVNLVHQHISPELNDSTSLFNREVASKFTEFSLMSHSSINQITTTLNELERFLSTLAIVNDQGKTAFNLAKARFLGENRSNPLSALYAQAQQLPEPVSIWAKQLADDTWVSLIADARNYINQQWQQVVFPAYQSTIANRYPFDAHQTQEIAMADFNRFFAAHGILNTFVDDYLAPFLDRSNPQWTLKEMDSYVLPISNEMINELIRANVITHMFFPNQNGESQIEFSLQKLNLDPIVSSLRLSIGDTKLMDTQSSAESDTTFHWPQTNARLILNSIEGKHYELEESGVWAFFKMLQKVNVLVDEQDSANLQILFEVNGNSGRYLLKTQNQVNPFIPGILNGFSLTDAVV